MSNFRKSKLYKKLIGLICIISVFTFNFNSAFAKSSKDKNYGSRWAQSTISEFFESGYIDSKESFELGQNITFVEANTLANRFIARQLNLDSETNTLKLDTSIYTEAMLYDYTANDYYITREEFACMLSKTLNIAPITNVKERFTDDSSISDYAKGYIYALEKKNIIMGYPDKSYMPNKRITIAEFITILNRSKDLLVNAAKAENTKLSIGKIDNTISGDTKSSNKSGNSVDSKDLFDIGDKISLDDSKVSGSNKAGDSIKKTSEDNTVTSVNLLASGEKINLEDNTISSKELEKTGETILIDDSDYIDKGKYHIQLGNGFAASLAYYVDGKLRSLPIDEDVSTLKGATMEVIFTMPKEYEDSKIKTTLSKSGVVTWNQDTHSLTTIGYGDVDVTFAIPYTHYKTSFKISVVKSI